jgi:predicted acylesterase/phospholipase RssA
LTGVSAGGINTAGIAGFAPEDVQNAAQFLSETWQSLSNPQIWEYWPLLDEEDSKTTPENEIEWSRVIDGFLTRISAINDAPALITLRGILEGFPE